MQQFVHNNRGVNDGQDFNARLLEELYINVQQQSLRIPHHNELSNPADLSPNLCAAHTLRPRKPPDCASHMAEPAAAGVQPRRISQRSVRRSGRRLRPCKSCRARLDARACQCAQAHERRPQEALLLHLLVTTAGPEGGPDNLQGLWGAPVLQQILGAVDTPVCQPFRLCCIVRRCRRAVAPLRPAVSAAASDCGRSRCMPCRVSRALRIQLEGSASGL